MTTPIEFPGEDRSNAVRAALTATEPRGLRTFTPSQAVIAKSAGVFHYTPEGRRLFDYTSGVLVSNLGHNPRSWMRRFARYLGWRPEHIAGDGGGGAEGGEGYFEAVALTAYNAMTELEAEATSRLLASLQATPHGARLQSVLWSASGSEAVQKALWACLHRAERRNLIVATRHGFHGKKGLAGACTGTEQDAERDPRVVFIGFPMTEVDDLDAAGRDIDLSRYEEELERLWSTHGERINCLITEPYLGGGGSFHPPSSYLQLLQRWCRAHDVLFVLDEVQSNFGRTGAMYAFEKHGIEPDFVCLGKGMGNGVPVNAAVGRTDILSGMNYGAGSDTWSAAPLGCAAVLATLDEFAAGDVVRRSQPLSDRLATGLRRLKATGLIAKVRGEGVVFGLECAAAGGLSPPEVAAKVVEACYLGRPEGDGIHLLGPLAGKVLRVSPPMTMSRAEANDSLELMHQIVSRLAGRLRK